MSQDQAIGVFDSGVGGLTVLKALRQKFPKQKFIYLGDTARLPYGTKSPETIRKYTEQNLEFLYQKNVQAMIIACNSASSQYLESAYKGKPVYNVIDPGVQAALHATQTHRVGLIATRATIASEAYQKRLHTEANKKNIQNLKVYEQATPLLVALAEEGWIDDPITNLICYRYLQPLLLKEVDVLILGCTHYPLLRTSLQKVGGSALILVDSSETLANRLQQDFESKKILPSLTNELDLYMTDISSHLQKWSNQILQEEIKFHLADVNDHHKNSGTGANKL